MKWIALQKSSDSYNALFFFPDCEKWNRILKRETIKRENKRNNSLYLFYLFFSFLCIITEFQISEKEYKKLYHTSVRVCVYVCIALVAAISCHYFAWVISIFLECKPYINLFFIYLHFIYGLKHWIVCVCDGWRAVKTEISFGLSKNTAQIFSYLYDFFSTNSAINRELVEFIHVTHKWHPIYMVHTAHTHTHTDIHLHTALLKIWENIYIYIA